MSPDRLQPLLRRSNRLRGLTLLGAAVCQATGLCVILVLLVLTLDACIGFGPWGLIGLDLVILAVGFGTVVYAVLTLVRNRFDPRRIAVMIEQQMGIDGSRLINAVDLAFAVPAGASPGLCRRAVRLGDETAAAVVVARIIDRWPLTRAAALGAVPLVLALATYVLVPGVFEAVVPRLVAPFADHPPFTLVQFDVDIEPDRVLYGKPVSLHARLSGLTAPDQATVVFVDADGRRHRLPMVCTSAPSEVAGRAGVMGAATSSQGALFTMQFDRAERSKRFYIETPQGRSRFHDLTVHPVPLFEGALLEYRFPKYTGWESAREPLSPGGIRALVGTTVGIEVTSNVVLGKGQVVITSASGFDQCTRTVLDPDPTQPTCVQGTIMISASGQYEMSLTGLDGTPGDETLRGTVTAVPDEPPGVVVTEPGPRVIVPEGWRVSVELAADDDVGVDRVVLQSTVNGWGLTPVDLAVTEPGGGHVTAIYAFDLAALGAVAGDVISYFAVAYDNHPDGGQTGKSPICAIEVITMDEYVEYARTRYHIENLEEEFNAVRQQLKAIEDDREVLVKQLDELEKGLEKRLDAAELEAMNKQLEMLRGELARFAMGTADLVRDMEDRARQLQLYEFEKPYQDMLLRLAKQLGEQVRNALELEAGIQRAQSEDGSYGLLGLSPLMSRFLGYEGPFGLEQELQWEQTAQDLEKIRLASEIIMQAERILSVILMQRELADRMARFRHKEKLGRLEQIRTTRMAEEQGQFRQELIDAIDTLRRLVVTAQEKLPKMSASVDGLCVAIDRLQVVRDQDDARQLANAGHGRYAHRAAERAAVKLESLLQDCQSMEGVAPDDLDGCLSLPRMRMANALRQLAKGRSVPSLGQSGSNGAGFSGSTAQMAVLGPVDRGDARSDAFGRAGRGVRGVGGSRGGVGAAETLVPETILPRRGGRGAVSGVPARYRDLAEAYFRRLAHESR